ncbi:unnamed protein product [Arctogadus glacialis]
MSFGPDLACLLRLICLLQHNPKLADARLAPIIITYRHECATPDAPLTVQTQACVNLPGSNRCDCLPSFIRGNEYSCHR